MAGCANDPNDASGAAIAAAATSRERAAFLIFRLCVKTRGRRSPMAKKGTNIAPGRLPRIFGMTNSI
ncbi:hypothetical protein C6Q08_14145 [Burkholderia multivorans]|nr:hypothetical protein C6Q08_14145 [Burkholderia multivorans]PRG87855.1 hypothetical protein C6V04_24840 [Burkholderia multivorans]PRH06588.1 hypothetical protein C6T60_12405 [Burkholderia multivorans]